MKLSSFSDFTRVVIVDDNQNEGNGIKGALEAIHIPGIFHHVANNRSLDDKVCKNVRLVFLDLMFSDSLSNNPAQNAGNAISKLSRVVDKTGFYILVIWSSHTTEPVADAFREHLERQTDFAKPYKTLALQKTDYITTRNQWRGNAIIRDIDQQLSEIPSLRVFLDWEGLVTDSVTEISEKVTKQRSHDDLSKAINSLAEAYAGKGKAKDKPQDALMAFNEVFRGVVSQKVISKDFGRLYTKINGGTLTDEEKAKLNTELIFTPDINLGPGSIFKIKQTVLQKKNFTADLINSNAPIGDAYDISTPIAIEITSLCNAAQKNATHAYFLNGLLHPTKYTTTGNTKKPFPLKGKGDYCYSLGKSFWSDEYNQEFTFSFNLKLFHTTLSKKYISLNKKFRDNLVIDLQHKISGYISRPGHVLL